MLVVLALWNGRAVARDGLGALTMETISPVTTGIALRPLVDGSGT
jgi:hypothetical protein